MKGLVLVAAMLASWGVSAEVVTVLGVPLEQPGKIPGLCSPAEDRTPKAMCWVSKPYVSKDGTRLGMVRLPNPSSRPEWATYATFDVLMGKSGTIRQIKATVAGTDDKHKIAQSISSRFGLPVWTSLAGPEPSGATWEHRDVFTRLICGNGNCYAEFHSAKLEAEIREEKRKREASAAAKPIAP
jgi:hypothetical protein